MIVDLTEIIEGYKEKVSFNFLYSFDNKYLNSTNIDRLDDVKVNAEVTRLDDDTISISIEASGYMWFGDETHKFDIDFEEIYTLNDELSEQYIKINENTIDILPIIWQNIVLEIPM